MLANSYVITICFIDTEIDFKYPKHSQKWNNYTRTLDSEETTPVDNSEIEQENPEQVVE